MEAVVVDRRRHPRVPREHTTWRQLRLRTGDTLVLLDIAPGGALVESRRRLLPGTAVVVHLVSPTRALSLRALVVRCCVCALDAHDGVVYRGALSFVDEDESAPVLCG
jgi:hypothetical protein